MMLGRSFCQNSLIKSVVHSPPLKCKLMTTRSLIQVGYFPIPRIEYTDESLDLVVENLALSGRNLFPNVIALEAHNYVRFSPYSVSFIRCLFLSS